MPPPILYSFRRCPYAMRARMAILSAGIDVELREILLKDKPASMIQASPKATVPVLLLPDQTVIDESLDVMRWALNESDPEQWTNADAMPLIDNNDGPFKAALDRYKYANRFMDENISTHEQRDICAATFEDYETRLAKHSYLLGDAPTIADNAIFPFVRQCANVDRAWFDNEPWPKLQAWLTEFLSSARFETAMRKYAPWKLDDVPLIFGR